jgi:cytochrome c5
MAAHSDTANHPIAQAQAEQQSHGDDGGHTSFIKTPRQLIIVVLLALLVPIVIIVLLASYVVNESRIGAGSDSMMPESIEARIRPVAGFELRDASAPQVARSGEDVYKAACGACHAAGVAGAPKHADSGSWSARIANGLESLVNSALKGKGAMPPQGGGEFSDVEVAKAVVYMANASGAKFEEPKSPANGEQAQGEAKAEGKAEGKAEAKAEGK